MVRGWERACGFRTRFTAKEKLFGSFLKLPSSHSAEMLGSLGYDFVIVDQEHGMFDRAALDAAILGALAYGCAPVVRVPSADPAGILQALDMGALGIIVPHVASVAQAKDIVSASRYRAGSRGFTGLSRSGEWGARKTWDHIDKSDEAIAVIAIMEDAAAVDLAGEIAAVDGLDGLFVGRADLAVALNEKSKDSPVLRQAVERIGAGAKAAGKPMMSTASAQEADYLDALGVTGLVLSSDQGFMRQAANKALTDFPRSPVA